MCHIAASGNGTDDDDDFGGGMKGGFELDYSAARDPDKLEGKSCEKGTFKVGSTFEKELTKSA